MADQPLAQRRLEAAPREGEASPAIEPALPASGERQPRDPATSDRDYHALAG
jgi:hypothetical protein